MCFFKYFIIFLSAQAYSDALDAQTAAAAGSIILSKHDHPAKGITFISDTSGKDAENVAIDELLSTTGQVMPFKCYRNLTVLAGENKSRSFFKVMLIDSLESFNKTLKVVVKVFHLSGYYLIIHEKAIVNDLRVMFQTLWDLYIHHVVILVKESSESVSVYTFVPFSEFWCNKTQPIKFTEFSKGSFTPPMKRFFPDKFTNYHKCPIKVTTFETLAPSVLREDFEDGSYRLYGHDVDIYRTLSEQLNFTPEIHFIVPFGGWGTLYPNGSATGAMGRAIRRETDFSIGNIVLKFDRTKFMEFSYGYFLDQLVLMIPPGRPLTSFETLVRPFEIVVWMILGGVFLCGFSVIAVLEIQSQSIKEFFFGKGVTTPFLNMLVAIFGGTQSTMPKRNFPRYLLMTFLIFSLVIR